MSKIEKDIFADFVVANRNMFSAQTLEIKTSCHIWHLAFVIRRFTKKTLKIKKQINPRGQDQDALVRKANLFPLPWTLDPLLNCSTLKY